MNFNHDYTDFTLNFNHKHTIFTLNFGHANKYNIKYVDLLFAEIPSLLGSKFKYSYISGSFRSRELSPALDLLEKANVIHRIYHSAARDLPPGAQKKLNRFKLLYLDHGHSQLVLGQYPSEWILNPEQAIINKGAIAESIIGLEIFAYLSGRVKPELYYWHRESAASNAEVDYIILRNREILPLEVKSGKKGRLKSLFQFLNEHPASPYGIQLNQSMPVRQAEYIVLPLYALVWLFKERLVFQLR